MSKTCSNCNATIKENQKFCTQCGTKYEEKFYEQKNKTENNTEKKSILIKFLKGEILLWKVFLIYIVILVITSFLNSLLFKITDNNLILNISNIAYSIILFILSVATWNSATNFMGLHYFWSVLSKIFSAFLILIGIKIFIDAITTI